MKYLFIAFLFISSFISGQGIEPTSLQPTQYQGGILRGVIPYVDEFTGETLYIYQHVDSLVFIKDSIYVRNDSIFLRDGTGFAIVTDSIYVVTGDTKDTIKLRDGNGFALVDKALSNGVKGVGVATRAAFWGGTDSLSSDAAFYWDNTNKRLGIGTATPSYKLDVSGTSGTVGIRTSSSTAGDILNYGTGTVSGDLNYLYTNINASGKLTNEIINSNTSTGSSRINLQVPAASTGDPYMTYTTSGANNWTHGVDNSDSDKFKIGPTDTPSSIDQSTGLVITTDGKIGWGTASPNYKFQIQGTKNTVGLSVRSDTGGDILVYGIGSVSGDITFFESNFNATGTLRARLENGNTTTGKSKFDIQVPNASSGDPYMTFTTGGAQNWTIGIDNSDSDKFKISQTDNPSSGWERIVVNTVGNVGIQQNNPIRTLDVNGEVRISDLVNDPATKILGADNDGDVSSVTVGNGLTLDGGSLTVTANINGTQNRVAKFTSQYAVGNSQIYTVGDSLVGINQSNPQYHLDVTGKFRVTNRTGTAATGAGFTADGQLISYSLDTAEATPNTYISAGSEINITGSGTMVDPYTINNSAPERTRVKDSQHLDLERITNDTITGTIIAGSIGPTELQSTSVSAGTYNYATIVVDSDGRITSASSNTDVSGITSIATTSPILGGPITSTGTISIQNAAADGSTKGAASFTSGDFNDNGSGLISIDYTNGQSSSGSTKGFLTSTDWNTFNNKQDLFNGYQLYSYTKNGTHYATEATNGPSGTTYHTVLNTIISDGTQGFQLANANSTDLWFRNKAGASFGSWYKLASQSWVTSQGYMDRWGYVTPSGTGAGVTSYISDDQVITYLNGTGITIGRASGTNNVTITNTGVTSLNGLVGAMFLSTGNSGTYPNWSSSGTTLIYNLPSGSSGQVLKHNGTGWTAGTDNNTDAQTLSFSSPNLSISGGNSVALPVLPSGSTNQTLRHDGSSWSSTSGVTVTSGNRMDINSWPGTVNLGSKLLVNGHIQYTNTGSAATTLTGRDGDGGLTSVGLSGLSLTSGTLSATDASISNEGSLTVGAGSSTTSTISSNTSGSTPITLSAGNGLIISEPGSNTVELDKYREYAHVYGDGSQNITTTPSNVQIAQGDVTPVNMTVNPSSDRINTAGGNFAYKWTVFGTIYNSSTTPSLVRVSMLRNGVVTFLYNQIDITCGEGNTNFSMSGISGGSANFGWQVSAAPIIGVLQLNNFHATVERL